MNDTACTATSPLPSSRQSAGNVVDRPVIRERAFDAAQRLVLSQPHMAIGQLEQNRLADFVLTIADRFEGWMNEPAIETCVSGWDPCAHSASAVCEAESGRPTARQAADTDLLRASDAGALVWIPGKGLHARTLDGLYAPVRTPGYNDTVVAAGAEPDGVTETDPVDSYISSDNEVMSLIRELDALERQTAAKIRELAIANAINSAAVRQMAAAS